MYKEETYMKFVAGKYYIGDPCYAVKDENWGKLIDDTGCFGIEDSECFENGCFTYNGSQCFTKGTAYGDGCYTDNYGREYGVDAGLIGIMPIEVCDGDYIEGGNVIMFEEDFYVSASNGVFNFGNIEIDTN